MSADSVKKQKNFCEKQNFPFSLLVDESKETIKAFGAWGLKKFMGREYEGIYRYSYLIDENGTIEKTFSKVNTKTHAKDVLAEIN
jgi:peroxiredoxin Q/BCP|tara:strand:+ start:836 stop:1090 length:255 start_codon:yes stop_codon:yes gene_type:complete